MDATTTFVILLTFSAAIALGLIAATSGGWAFARPEKWLVIAILVLTLFPSRIGDGLEGSLFRQVTWASLFAFSFVVAVRRSSHAQAQSMLQMVPLPLAVLVCYVVLSVLWSDHPGTSLKRASQIIGVLVIALAFGRLAQQGNDLLRRLLVPTIAFVCIGLAVALFAPGFGVDHDGAVRGFTAHKNTWGTFSALACITVAFAIKRSVSTRRWPLVLAFALCLLSLVASRSATSIVAFAIGMLGVLFWYVVARGNSVSRMAACAAICTGLLATHAYLLATGEFPFGRIADVFYAITERNRSFSGREFLWQLMEIEIGRHPWFGLGYGSFWVAATESSSRWIVERLTWGPPAQAHNGYLDIINELGVVGLALMVLVLVRHAANITLVYSRGARDLALFHAAIVATVLITNWTETSLLRTTHLLWIVLCISIVELHVRVNAAHTNEMRLPPLGVRRKEVWPYPIA